MPTLIKGEAHEAFENYFQLVAGISSKSYERARYAIAMIESSGDVSARNKVSTASGKYQFMRAWDPWFKANYGRTWSSAVPSRRSSRQVKRAAESVQDAMFDLYYQEKVEPWIGWVRRAGLGRKLSDAELLGLFHRQGSAEAEHFLRTGRDPNAGTHGNRNIRIYLAQLRRFFNSRRQMVVKEVLFDRTVVMVD